jgi:hypothetical protein
MRIVVKAEYVTLVAPCISTEKTRYYLNGVHFARHGTGVVLVTTDGHRMAVAFDAVGVADYDGDAGPIFPIAKDLAKACEAQRSDNSLTRYAMFDGRRASVWLGGAELDFNDDGLPAAIKLADFPCEAIDGVYPEWQRVVPFKTDPKPVISAFSATYLGVFADIATAANEGRRGACMTVHGSDDGTGPAIIRFGNRSDVFGVLMPLRYNGETGVPEWCSNPPQEKRKAA